MKLVAVSQRVDFYPERNETRDALDQQLIRWLDVAGYLAVPVPNGLLLDRLKIWLDGVAPEAIVLSGGNDIGQVNERDNTERQLLRYALEKNLPVLGICRGMQMMAVVQGVELSPVEGHVRIRHVLQGDINDEVNSFHNFGLKTCPDGYRVMATSADSSIEAIRHVSLSWEGWMWHPEREAEFNPNDMQRLNELFR
tara:strand:+ start:252 stop:839 length:588 start_codon:yes stop_codon:yes gene_type:complete